MGTFAGFAAVLAKIAAELPIAEHEALEESAILVEKTAKGALGTYSFGWPALKPDTIARKATGDSPLLETGALRDSIDHRVVGEHEALIGTNDPSARFLELGTSKMPPRPFLSEAARRSLPEIEHLFRGKVGAMLKLR